MIAPVEAPVQHFVFLAVPNIPCIHTMPPTSQPHLIAAHGVKHAMHGHWDQVQQTSPFSPLNTPRPLCVIFTPSFTRIDYYYYCAMRCVVVCCGSPTRTATRRTRPGGRACGSSKTSRRAAAGKGATPPPTTRWVDTYLRVCACLSLLLLFLTDHCAILAPRRSRIPPSLPPTSRALATSF